MNSDGSILGPSIPFMSSAIVPLFVARDIFEALRPPIEPIPEDMLDGGALDLALRKADHPEETAEPIAPPPACK